MTIRPATALTALALAAVATTSLTACGGGNDSAAPASAPKVSPVAAVAQDTTPLAVGESKASFEGAFTGSFTKHDDAKCDLDDEYDVTLNGDVNGAATAFDISFLSYKTPGRYGIADAGITFDVAQSDARKDWRNEGIGTGVGSVTYNPDGRTGSFDVTLPEISYDEAKTLPNNPTLHVAGRWSCGTASSS